ncbi:DNA mismatch repair endonuclease MutL [Robertkochia aurantiaca]|uniref:DNA mismatch repair endonuclease MutL n=1 Tax=Robertkochia aurantiaca TaxID=2873700 RepID=UPI001CCA4242|nr:DNA mismatch repair endonuclease MutL [Robertkochia sp. 3YJGBD-33]
MADIIQLLPDHVANQIAAGEVVQRPASVVKELLENAIDAAADHIQLIIKDAGKTLVQVVDNGTGMSTTDARISFERHATSKIRVAEDLFHLHTKGFRGEALASIAAIAQVEMTTRREEDEVATRIKIEGSDFIDQDVVAAPVGTSVLVKNLFYNIPARRNFLKSDNVELRHIIDEFHRVALAHPAIRFDLFSNGSELFKLPSSNIRQRIVNILGGKTNEKLVPVEEETEVVHVKGFVGKPEFARKTRGEQFFFVNDRFVKNSYLHHAVTAAFEGLLKDKTHPSYFLFLEIDPESIDINIHPTKTEVKFDDEHSLYAILRSAIKHSLGQFNVAPVLDFDRDANLDTPYDYRSQQANMPAIEVDADFNPFREESAQSGSRAGRESYRSTSKSSGSWESLYVGAKNPDDFATIELESEEVSGQLFDEKEISSQNTVTYQLNRKYIVSTIKSGMVIIDQHRAHQRILYEEFLKNMTLKKGISQQLLFPLELNLSSTELSLLNELKESLENTGFAFSASGSDRLQVTGIPANVGESEAGMVLEQLLSDFQNEIPDAAYSQADKLAKTLCKTLAVRSGEPMNDAEQQSLVNNLFATKEPSVTPFNRPTFITMTVEEIDKKFI